MRQRDRLIAEPVCEVSYDLGETYQLVLEQIAVDRKLEREGEEERAKWVENELKKRDYKNFYTDARVYAGGNWGKWPLQKAHVLAKHYERFSANGKQPLVDKDGNLSGEVLSKDRPKMYIGKIFNEVYTGVTKFLGYR
ncbi:MAG: hypothetical protein AABW91_03615 [Nanoarchaeota archaeon]